MFRSLVVLILISVSLRAHAESVYEFDDTVVKEALASIQRSINEMDAIIRAQPVYVSYFRSTPAAIYADLQSSHTVAPSQMRIDRTAKVVSSATVRTSNGIR